MLTYYDILKVDVSATQDEIKRSFRKLAKIYHPDSDSGDEEKFKKINLAFSVLSDPLKRQKYDLTIRVSEKTTYSMNKNNGDVDFGDYYSEILRYGAKQMLMGIYIDAVSHCIYPQKLASLKKVIERFVEESKFQILDLFVELLQTLSSDGLFAAEMTYRVSKNNLSEEDDYTLKWLVTMFSKLGVDFFTKVSEFDELNDESILIKLKTIMEKNDEYSEELYKESELKKYV